MNASDADRQIKQMVNFILQEAQEKANEIRIKTEHDFNLEKQMLVHNAKLKIQDEYVRKEKEREVNKRIARSAEIGASRRQKMIARDELLKTLLLDAQSECKPSADTQKNLMKLLIVQGLIKLYEAEVVLHVKKAEESLCKSVINDAVAEYKAVMKSEANLDVSNVKVTMGAEGLPDSTTGGVILTAKQGKIVCDNTLDTRLDQVYYDLKPIIRKNLFPSA